MGEEMRRLSFCCFAVGLLITLLTGCGVNLILSRVGYAEIFVDWGEYKYCAKQLPTIDAKQESKSFNPKEIIIEEVLVNSVEVRIDPSTPLEQSYVFTKDSLNIWTPYLDIGNHTIIAIENGTGATNIGNYKEFNVAIAKSLRIIIQPGSVLISVQK